MEKFIEILKYLALGLIQGIAEPLPISSSGHIVVLDQLFGGIIEQEAMNNFQIIVNFASLLAIIIFFRKHLAKIITGSFNYVFKKDQDIKSEFNYLLYIIIATIPVMIVGVILTIFDLDNYLVNILVIGISLIITSGILFFGYLLSKKAHRNELNIKDSIFIGLIQIFSLVSGISRSGITTTAGLKREVELEESWRFSFMLYIPVSLGVTLLGAYNLISVGFAAEVSLVGLGVSFIASFIGTLLVIKLFYKLFSNKYLKVFSIYCLVVGVIIISLYGFGVI